VFLLDEPVAGINPETIQKILGVIRKLPEKGKTVLLIEHNIEAVMQICDLVIFMDEGKKIAEGDPESVRNNPAVIKAYLE
jgi:ABC-type branched-subunit amino acid transport system ATPase component